MHNSKPIDTPLASNHNLHTTETSAMAMDGTTNRSLVAPLQCLTLTHSRLSHEVNLDLAVHGCNELKDIVKLLKRILLYIKGTTLWSWNHLVHFKPVRLLRCRLGRLPTNKALYHQVLNISWCELHLLGL
eukprot:TRINITY_DN33068_c0_g1_i1.p1 TRINITY_DN33068_c0_g1~~TRINITY_DN33068_c0_g1_i1.p1  ORF type:complete len:130 (+),score=8.97 TRINITY_DN33068_c0_g1_i1:808-1197(+)